MVLVGWARDAQSLVGIDDHVSRERAVTRR
jgi:hypothetical protein